MSSQSEPPGQELEGADEVCASCGVAGVDDVKFKMCDGGCDLVKCCSVECQENHRPKHKKACKKRLAELHDIKLFTQPDISYMGGCPICCLPLSIHPRKSVMMECCSKVICKGCFYANKKREFEQGLQSRCAFCREPVGKSDEEGIKQIMKRVKKNDPAAMVYMGKTHREKGDYAVALEYYTKAAELGDVAAYFCLGALYYYGNGVEKDEEKAVYHFEQAAIGGHAQARTFLGIHDMDNGRFERAAKHFIIGANLGCDLSPKYVKDLFMQGVVSKDEYAAALRGYQAAVDATKSAERVKGEAY